MRALGVAVLFLFVAACGGSKNVLPTTTVPSVPPTTAAALNTVPAHHFGSPEEVMQYLYLQWKANDPGAASAAATPDAVTALFAKPAGGNQFRGCSNPADKSLGSDCTYQYGQGLLQIHVSFANNNWQATMVQFVG